MLQLTASITPRKNMGRKDVAGLFVAHPATSSTSPTADAMEGR
jgi:hypothetical protein